jgi:flagellar biosynthesis protein FlhF
MIPSGLFVIFRKEGVEVSGPIPQVQLNSVNSLQAMGSYSGRGLPDLVKRNTPKDLLSVKEPWPPKDASSSKELASSRELRSQKEPLDFDKEKIKVMAAAGQKDPVLQMVLSEVRSIKEKIDERNQVSTHEEHATLSRIEEILSLNDFSPSYRKKILDRLKKEFPLDSLNNFDLIQDKVLEWIGESITIYHDGKFRRRPRIMILVGPTGVGKTTTIAKLAANFGIDQNGRRIKEIVLITTDTFRIGARQQVEAYGKILQAPCFAVEDDNELKKTIAENSDGIDFILIDTPGKSPRDLIRLGEIKELLDACGSQAEIHLVVSASTKASDIQESFQQYEPFNYRSVIITKLDETTRVGNVVGILAEKQKPVSYITNGQKVPADIRKASIITFLINLEGFKVNRIKLEERFPDTDSEQLRKWS